MPAEIVIVRYKKPTELRNLLQRQTQAAETVALRSDGEIPAAQVESLGRLARLVEICDLAQPPPIRKHWPSVSILLVTLVVVSVLLFARVSETEVDLDAATSEVSFVLQNQQPLIPQMSLHRLGASGLSEIQIPPSRNREAQVISSPNSESDILLSVASDGRRQGTINVALTAPAGIRVDVSNGDMPPEWQLSIERDQNELIATVAGPVRVGISNTTPTELYFVTPKVVLLRPDRNGVQLRMVPATASVAMPPQLLVSNLSLLHIEQTMDAYRTVVRRLSTVLSGTLRLEALNGQTSILRRGEELEFGLSNGEIRNLRLEGDHVVVNFHGRVRDMTVGTGNNRRSLMPTWLDWLKARHGLSLLWGTTLYVFGLILGLLRWSRSSL